MDEAAGALWSQAHPGSDPVVRPVEGGPGDALEIPDLRSFWAFSLPFDSGIGFLPTAFPPFGAPPPVVLPLKGRANLTATRPLGLAYDSNRGLLAVANRSGGSVHLVALTKGSGPR